MALCPRLPRPLSKIRVGWPSLSTRRTIIHGSSRSLRSAMSSQSSKMCLSTMTETTGLRRQLSHPFMRKLINQSDTTSPTPRSNPAVPCTPIKKRRGPLRAALGQSLPAAKPRQRGSSPKRCAQSTTTIAERGPTTRASGDLSGSLERKLKTSSRRSDTKSRLRKSK